MIWARPEQTGPIRRAVERAGVSIVGAGCPDPTRGSEVAAALGCDHIDDLRRMLSAESPDLVLLADPGGFGDRDLETDLVALQQAHSRETAVATLEPIPAEATVVSGTSWSDSLQSGALSQFVQQVPLLRHTRVIEELAASLETFGRIRSMSCSLMSPAILGSLGARLFDTMDLVRTLVGVPETIDASYAAASSRAGLHELPGQSLRGLHGILTIHARMPDGRGAIVQVSDQAGRSTLAMNLVGAEGNIELTDRGFTRYDADGAEIDACVIERDAGTDPTEARLSEQLIQLCSGVASTTRAPVDHASVLAMGHTTLLSARTGQGETPETIRRLLMEV